MKFAGLRTKNAKKANEEKAKKEAEDKSFKQAIRKNVDKDNVLENAEQEKKRQSIIEGVKK
jgi:hypothetical protein